MGANASSTTQKLQTYTKNRVGVSYDIDASTTCKLAGDASQTMTGIKITGSDNVNLSQLSKLQNLCYAQQVLKSDQFNKLTQQEQDDIMNTAQQEGGIGININNSTIENQKRVETQIDLKTKLDITKKCLLSLNAPQRMDNITIENAKNIDLTQQSDVFNKCIFDEATKLGVTNLSDTDLTTKSTQTSSQKGWDPIASIASLGMTGFLISMAVPIGIVIISSGSSMAMSMSGTTPQPPEYAPMDYSTVQQGGAKLKKVWKWVLLFIAIIVAYYVLTYLFSSNNDNNNRENFEGVSCKALKYRRGCFKDCVDHPSHEKEFNTAPHPQNIFNPHPIFHHPVRHDMPLITRQEYYNPHLIQELLPTGYPVDQLPNFSWRVK